MRISLEQMTPFLEDIQQKMENSKVLTETTCELWDLIKHAAYLYLFVNPPSGLIITYSISGGIHDWTIIKKESHPSG
jgi:hypothetical protein